MAFVTMVLGAIGVAALAFPTSGGAADPAVVAVVGLYGVAIFGIPAMIVTVPAAMTWAWLTRRFSRFDAPDGVPRWDA